MTKLGINYTYGSINNQQENGVDSYVFDENNIIHIKCCTIYKPISVIISMLYFILNVFSIVSANLYDINSNEKTCSNKSDVENTIKTLHTSCITYNVVESLLCIFVCILIYNRKYYMQFILCCILIVKCIFNYVIIGIYYNEICNIPLYIKLCFGLFILLVETTDVIICISVLCLFFN